MKSIIVSPSPNWYCTRVIDSNSEGIIAYGTRGFVCLLDCKQYPPVFLDLFLAHHDRLLSLAFSQCNENCKLLATGSEDGKAKIWNIETKECLHCNADFEKITCIDWQTGSNDILYVATEKQGLFVWETALKSLTSIKTGEKNALLVIKSCPSNTEWIAAGYKGGLVAIINCNKGHIIKKFRGHEDEVLSLAWSSVCIEQQENQLSEYLASCSRDKTLRIWDIAAERVAHILTVPRTRKVGHYEESNKGRLWSAVSWCQNSTHTLLSTTFTGEMIFWNLEKEGKQKWEVFKTGDAGGHNKCIFTIIPIRPKYEMIISISLDRQIVLWSLEEKKSLAVLPTIGGYSYALAFCPQGTGRLAVGSADNIIRILNTTGPIAKTTGTFWQGIKAKVISISWHPEKEGLLAFGTNEGRVGIINVMTNRPPIIFQSFHKESVYRVTWGPDSHSFESKENIPSKQNMALYSCGDFLIYIHNPSDTVAYAVNFDSIVEAVNSAYKPLQRTELCWRTDMSAVAVGNSDGSIEIFSGSDLHLLAQLCSQRKLVNCLLWHPPFTVTSNTEESLHAWLACASNDSTIYIYNLIGILEKEQEEERKITVISQPIRSLAGHHSRVVSLSWSCQLEGRLASASYDGTAQIWDALSGAPLANYRGHNGRLFSIAWSMSDPDICYTGGEDYTVHKWNVSEQENHTPPTKQSMQNSKKKTREIKLKSDEDNKLQQTHLIINEDKTPQTQSLSEEDTKMLQDLIEEKKKQLLESIEEVAIVQENIVTENAEETKPEVANEVLPQQDERFDENENIEVNEEPSDDNSSSPSEELCTIKKVIGKGISKAGKTRKTQKSFFPYSMSLENRGKRFSYDDCTLLTDLLCAEAEGNDTDKDDDIQEHKTDERNNIHLGLFSTRKAAWKMIDAEENYHKKLENLDYALQLEIWKGNIGNALREAAKKRKLNDYLVSLAPLGSRDLWREMCEKYAKQLEAEGAIHKAVLYLLSIHEVYKAINLLRANKQYREALSLAKLRLPSSDSLITTLLKEWATKANKDGNNTLAAKCYLALREFSQASKQLLSNTDSGSMKTAAYISRKCGNTIESQNYLASCIKIALKKNEWDLAKEAVLQHPEVKPISLVISTHSLLYEHTDNFQSLSSTLDLISSIIEDDNEPLETMIWEKMIIEKNSFLHTVYWNWITENLLEENPLPDLLLQYYQIIANLMVIPQHPSTLKEYYVIVAVEFSLALLAVWKKVEDESMKGAALKHLNRIMTLSNAMKN